jgi:enamine deaminase RidA (YjgF/YER057c/UK114 family)
MPVPEVDELSQLVAQLEHEVDRVIQQRDEAVANAGIPVEDVVAATGKVRSLYERVTQALR